MTLPKFSEITLPLLQFAKDGNEHSVNDAEEHLAKHFKLTEEERNQLKPSGNEKLFLHRIRWVRTALKWAVLIEDTKMSHFKITERGLDILKQNPPKISEKFLLQFPEYKQHRRKDSDYLEELIRDFDQNRNFSKNKPEHIRLAELEREEFVKKFPLNRIPNISLDEYVVGKLPSDKNTFSYMVEYGTNNFGVVKGGSAAKHGVYVDKDTQEIVYDKKAYSAPKQAFESIRQRIYDIVKTAEKHTIEGDWKRFGEQIEGRKSFVNIAILSKILALYFPEKFLAIWSHPWMNDILDELGIPRKDLEDNKSFYEKQGRIWQKKNSHPIMKEWNQYFFSDFLGTLINEEDDEESWYWMIRPGKGASEWENQRTHRVVAVSFYEKLGSLDQFYNSDGTVNEENLKKAISKYEEKRGAIRTNARQLRDFMSIREGDKVLAIEGKQRILGIGQVRGKYKYRPELGYPHTFPVEWYDTKTRNISKSWQGTILSITKEEFDQLVNGKDSGNGDYQRYEQILEKKKQLIFYGPPGTGKTREAVRFADWLVSKNQNMQLDQPESTKSSSDEQHQHSDLEKYQYNVIFHQSYSYEEFVEGIKANVDEKKNLTYDIEDGIFKIICENAQNQPNKIFVLIIDEINRGNISKIFGELISLIEIDKRASLSVNLAYSKQLFTVPKNVYILGTMNTADRSLVQIDIALRRRFGFVELMPKPWLLESIEDISLEKLLINLNKKILEVGGNREQQIGHSYFMKNSKSISSIEELKLAFEIEIIPLLQEYFFEDYSILEKVLGSTFVSSTDKIINNLTLDEFKQGIKELLK